MMSQLLDSKAILIACGLVFLGHISAMGQLSLVNTSPLHGAVNVDTAATFSLTFDSPINTTAVFPYPEDFFISLWLYPDSLTGAPDSITMSPDLKTVFIHNIHLHPNTTYTILIVDAVSQAGDSLDMPSFFVITTGNSLPTATVSGTISYPAGNPTGTFVALFNDNPIGENEAEVVGGSVVSNISGLYTMDYIPSGLVWAAGVKDFIINENGELDLIPGTALGFYDSDGDFVPDSFDVASGASISDIDISLTEVTSITARSQHQNIENLAQAWSPDAILVRIGGEFDWTGFSIFWQFLYYSPSLNQQRGYATMGNLVAVFNISEISDDTLEVPTNWLDSDTIMAIAEANDGYQFRQEHPDAEIHGFLGYISFNKSGKSNQSIYKKSLFNQREQHIFRIFAGPQSIIWTDAQIEMIPSQAAWLIEYYSDSSNTVLQFIIEPETGAILNAPATAAVVEQKALPIAQGWSSDARLWAIFANWTSVDSTGKTTWWNCLYYSSLLDSLHMISVWGQLPLFTGWPGWVPVDTTTVASGWIDSDAAISVAEANGGADYRNTNDSVFVDATLSRWWFSYNPSQTVWHFNYTSLTSDTLKMIVDALTGHLVSIEDPSIIENIPSDYILNQNYPNPFNPSTKIQYSVPLSGKLELSVYNLIGQKIATLVEKNHLPGNYQVNWEPENLASGIYLITLRAEKSYKVLKTLYLK